MSDLFSRSPDVRLPRGLYALLLFCSLGAIPASAQASAASAPAASPAAQDARATTLAQATTLRDAFIKRVGAAGFTCPLAPPAIVVEDVPSFGQYQPSTNTLRTSDWTVLRPQERGMFTQLAGPGADEAAARSLFELAAHHWIFIHELGHWWQACTGGNTHRTHYQTELGANRISLAYWREVDPTVVQKMIPVFQGVVTHAPNPVPAGQSVEDYFNANYERLGPSPAYPWFMSRMNVAAFDEKPAPSFAAVIAATKTTP